MSLLVLSAKDVDTIVSAYQPEDLQLLMAQVFSQFSHRGKELESCQSMPSISIPPRLRFPTLNHTALFMPARIGPATNSNADVASSVQGNTALKVVCVPNKSDARGLPATTVVLDETTGSVKAIVNARKLTALRNAAGSLLSTSILAIPFPKSITAFGAGQQVESHLDLFLRHFPSITDCTIVNRSLNDRASSLHRRTVAKFPLTAVQLLAFGSVGDKITMDDRNGMIKTALGTTDIIICATSSTLPLFPSSWVRDDTHVILIGSYKPEMREVDRDLILRSLRGTLLVDSREACLREAGEILDARVQPEQMTEIGELLPKGVDEHFDLQVYFRTPSTAAPDRPQREFDGPVTVFKSVGIAVQDVVIASSIVERAYSLGGRIGTTVSEYDL